MFEVSTLCKRLSRAIKEEEESRLYYQDLSSTAPENVLQVWRKEIRHAEKTRHEDPKAMQIMKNRLSKGMN